MQPISWAPLLWLFRVYVLCLAWQQLAAGRLSWHRLTAGDSSTSSACLQAARARAGCCHTCHSSPSWQWWWWIALGGLNPSSSRWWPVAARGIPTDPQAGFEDVGASENKLRFWMAPVQRWALYTNWQGRGGGGRRKLLEGVCLSSRACGYLVAQGVVLLTKRPKSSEGRPCSSPQLGYFKRLRFYSSAHRKFVLTMAYR